MPVKYVPKLRRVPLLPPPEAPDWAGIVRFLLNKGVPRTRIASNCRMARETIADILEGRSEPKYTQGQMLLQIKQYVEAAA